MSASNRGQSKVSYSERAKTLIAEAKVLERMATEKRSLARSYVVLAEAEREGHA